MRVWSRNDARQVVFLSVMPADVEDWRARSATLQSGVRASAGRADVLGRGLVLGSRSMTIVGVMPPRFAIPNAEADVWLPLDTDVPPPDRFSHTLRVIVRAPARDGAAAVKRDLDAIAAQLGTERPANDAGWSVTVQPLFDTVVSPELRQSLGITAGAVLFLLLMATSSVAGLLLGRSASRERELAVRVALGGSRGSLVRLLLLESL